MKCEIHGEVESPIDGKCPLCLKEEVLSQIEDVAHGRWKSSIGSADPPLCYVPALALKPSDFPWLEDESIDISRIRMLRSMLAHTYLLAISAILQTPQSVQDFLNASLLLGPALSFDPEEHWIWWEIHYKIGGIVKDVLNVRGDLDKDPLSSEAKNSLATVAVHMDLAFRHLKLASQEGYKAAPIEEAYAGSLLREIPELMELQIGKNRVVGDADVGSGPIEEYLFPGTSKGPGID